MPKGVKLAFPVHGEELPEGRLVQGDIFEMSTKDKMGNIRTVKNGPNSGQPSPQLIVVVAYAKNDPKWLALKQHWKNKAAEDFPQFFPNGPNGACTHPNFAWKWQDGDGVDGDGKPNSNKEGWAGHDVVRYTSGFPAKVYHKDHYAPQEEVFRKPNEAHPCPRGFFIRVCGTTEGNNDLTRPGMFHNCSLVEISRPGPEIRTGPNAAAAFGSGDGAPGVVAGAGALVMLNGQSYEAFKTAGWSDDQMIAAGHALRAAPPPPPPAPTAPPSGGPVYTMTASANGSTREAMLAIGWTDEALIAAGYMTVQAPAVAPPPPIGVVPPPPGTAHTQGAAASSGAPLPPGANGGATQSPSNPPPPPYGGYMAAGGTAPPPSVPQYRMTEAAQGQTREAMLGAGWSDAMLIQNGMMVQV